MRYTWDPEKNRRNKAKHRIAFEDAVRIFARRTVEFIDERFDYGEERLQAMGLLGTKIIVVTYVDRHEEERRIISARNATPSEARIYFEAPGL